MQPNNVLECINTFVLMTYRNKSIMELTQEPIPSDQVVTTKKVISEKEKSICKKLDLHVRLGLILTRDNCHQ